MNHWKIALRSLRKSKFYGGINVLGLTVGLAGCLLIILYLNYELGYDRFLADREQIYQVNLNASFGGDDFITSNTPPPVGATMQAEFPEIESYTRHFMPGDQVVRRDDQFFTESDLWLVDSNFLTFFQFPLLEGNPATCLQGTNAVVLTEDIARKYFGDTPALQQIIHIENQPYTVTGVLQNLPRQSSLQFDILVPIASSALIERFSWSWVWLQMDTYVRLQAGVDENQLAVLEAKFPAMVRKYAANAFKRIGQDLETFFAEGNRWDLSLNPIQKLHLYSTAVSSHIDTKGNIRDIYIFGIVGLCLLLLACINFMNLTTARALGRAKEVGIRKILGSRRATLVRQFLAESLLYSVLSGLLALLLVYTLLPGFNQLMHLDLRATDLATGWTLAAVIGLPILTGLLAGAYPAAYLSKFKPIKVLKSRKYTATGDDIWIRNGLVVFQFVISVALVICTLIVLQQIKFSINSDLGMDQENVLIVSNLHQLEQQQTTFKNELLNLPGVLHASSSTDLPAGGAFGDFYVPEKTADNASNLENLTLYSYLVDEDFVPAMGIELIAGRNFAEARGMDSLAVIINETTAKMIGWKNPIGKHLRYPGGNDRNYEVVGVMKDFHSFSLRESIEPFALFHESSQAYQLDQGFLAAKIKPGMERAVIDQAKALWAELVPATPFEFSFLDENIHAQYQSEALLGSVLTAFTILSILIACLGLFGLVTYITEQRTREIGIRKVLGASVASIIGLVSKDFLKLILLALVIASPIAWYFMEQWLTDFAYRIDIQWWIFALAGGVALTIAFLTVCLRAVRAALANPVESLRSE